MLLCHYNDPMARIVFMGSPEFALPSLRALAQKYEVVGVVTQPDRAAGRGREVKMPPVKTLALELGLPVMQPEKLKQHEAMEQLRAWAPDLVVGRRLGRSSKRTFCSCRALVVSTSMPRYCRAGGERRRSMLRFWQGMKRPA